MARALLFLLVASAALAFGGAAAAQSSGNVAVSGAVAGACSVTAGTLGGTISLTELAGPGGTLAPAMAGNTVSGAQVAFRITCNTGAPKISLGATRLANPATAATGYANVVDYKATADITHTAGSQAVAYTTAATPPAATAATMTNPFSTAAGNNVVVRVSNLAAPAPADVLLAGGYTATISITITPS